MYLFLKSFFDRSISFISILFLLPFFLLISLLIIIIDKEKPFFRQIRIGYKKRKFYILKFRTMTRRVQIESKETLGINDPRITALGKILRKTKIDELPQLVNIFLGQMSFVGPRPEIPYYAENYNSKEQIVFQVKPGLTDFATLDLINIDKIFDNRDIYSPEEFYKNKIQTLKKKKQLDYIQKISFWNDLKIIFLSIFFIFKNMNG
tara:strand:+ start:895 stop:1512 length:618 start_codon:yes stop_codon:yes gene_type:complete